MKKAILWFFAIVFLLGCLELLPLGYKTIPYPIAITSNPVNPMVFGEALESNDEKLAEINSITSPDFEFTFLAKVRRANILFNLLGGRITQTNNPPRLICKINQKILVTAIKGFNASNPKKIQNFEETLISSQGSPLGILRLKSIDVQKKPCVYKSYGSLAKDGFIYCKQHGRL